jgi:tetratricopeptide (TPR) repeat protein
MTAFNAGLNGGRMRQAISTLSALTLLVQTTGVAAADDRNDCKLSPTEVRIAACTRIINKGDDGPRVVSGAYTYRGNAFRNRGDNERAIADYTRAMETDPNLASLNLGLVLVSKGELDLAIVAFTETIKHDPQNFVALNARGSAYQNKGESDRAIIDYSEAIRIDPDFAYAYRNRGAAYHAKGDRERAVADYDKAIFLSQKFSDAYNSRGFLHGANGDFKRAIADYAKAIEFDPKFARPYNNRGNIHKRNGDYVRALADYTKAIELEPTYPVSYLNRGDLYSKKRDNEKAIADFRKILELPALSEIDRQRHELVRARILRATQQVRQSAIKPPAQRVALVIGNSRYAHAGELSNPGNDARATAAALRRLGFSQVIERHDLTREQMGQALKEFGDLTEGAEWAVVFFAGHGMEMNGVTYLIPTDAALERDTHLADETISLTQVQTKVDAASKLGLVILDSCRNNPFSVRMIRSAGSTRSIGRGLANIEPEGNVLVAYSAKHGTTASDGDGQNSPFTAALLSHIEEPGLEINFLFRKIRDDVRARTQRSQEPFLYGSLSSEPLFFSAAVAR